MSNVSPTPPIANVPGASASSYSFHVGIAPHVQEYLDGLPPIAERSPVPSQTAPAPPRNA